jgi:hypothetical protein
MHMWILGHAGLGYQISKWMGQDKPLKFLILGTQLPDLIDKPLYYFARKLTGREGSDIGLISGTRTFGHTLIFFGILVCCYVFMLSRDRGKSTRVPKMKAIIVGVATHLLLDFFSKMEVFIGSWGPRSNSKTLEFVTHVLCWPAFGLNFPGQDLKQVMTFTDILPPPIVFLSDIVGAIILWRLWRSRFDAHNLRR